MHRMAKTFDNLSKTNATNYLFLFTQRTLALQNDPPTPPPLNALGLPCEAMCLLWAWMHATKTWTKTAVSKGEAMDTKQEIAGKISPLAEKITEYILDNQDGTEKDFEGETMKRFRHLSDSGDRQRVAINRLGRRFHEVHAKMDETLQFVKHIADLAKYSSSTSTRQALEA